MTITSGRITCPRPLPLRSLNSELWPDYRSRVSLTHTVKTRGNPPYPVSEIGPFCFVKSKRVTVHSSPGHHYKQILRQDKTTPRLSSWRRRTQSDAVLGRPQTGMRQDTMSATWRKERSTVETNEIMKTAAHRSESWCWCQLLCLLSHVLMLVLTQLVWGCSNCPEADTANKIWQECLGWTCAIFPLNAYISRP
jgi:hypothetical protein